VYLSNAILGKTVVDQLVQRQSSPVLMIGSDGFTRVQLSKIGCFNFQAAARLTHLITNELKVKNTRELFFNVPPQHLALPGLGAICLATIGAAFEVKGLGNLADYISKHSEKGQHAITFMRMKHNVLDQQAAKNEKKELKRRTSQRKDKAHEIRVERHVTRSGNGTTATH
jgi:hypothetical protein